jgi:transposase
MRPARPVPDPRVAGRKQDPCRDLLECLRDRHDDIVRFSTDTRIPPTSNHKG